jgi:hypothetical protein
MIKKLSIKDFEKKKYENQGKFLRQAQEPESI